MEVIYDPNRQVVPIKTWLAELDAGTLEQALNLARLPFAAHHVALMPDAHLGYGMPIGGVLAARDHIVPNAVGVDIGCFAGDTLVPLVDGRDYPIAELAARGEAFLAWAVTPAGRIVPAEATARRTRRAAPLVRVTLDNGESVRCTPDHEFMLRDGTYVPARQLAAGTSLMPFDAERDRDGYLLIQQPCSGRRQRAHGIPDFRVTPDPVLGYPRRYVLTTRRDGGLSIQVAPDGRFLITPEKPPLALPQYFGLRRISAA